SMHIKKLLALGINGFVIKNSPKEEIIKAVNQVLSGEDYYSKEVMNTIIGSISKKRPVQRLTYEVPLTDREKEVLKLICEEMSNQEIADQLFISTRTVESHKRKLLEKTGCKNIAGLVLYALEKGYLQ
ncbi:MAG: response regulator transcription factor, partial [Marinoscillum sp.]